MLGASRAGRFRGSRRRADHRTRAGATLVAVHRLLAGHTLVAVLGLGVPFANVAWSAERVVYPDGSGDFPTIQLAIWASQDGDVVSLAPGTFVEAGIDFQGKAITLQALNGPGTSSLVAGASGLFELDSGEGPETRISGLVFTGLMGNHGVAVSCDGSSPTFSECLFDAVRGPNTTALYATGAGPLVENCVFRGCVTALDLRGSTSNPITNCRFEDNRTGLAILGGNGARVVSSEFSGNGNGLLAPGFQGNLLIEDCLFRSNDEGAYLRGDLGRFTITNSEFLDNMDYGAYVLPREATISACTFRGNGGAGEFGALAATDTELTDCTFEANRALHAGAVDGASLMLRRCVFRDNSANGYGEEDGFGGALRLNALCEIDECLFVGNSGGHGAAIRVEFGNTTLRDCTFAFNTGYFASVFDLGAAAVRAERILVYGSERGPSVACAGTSTFAVACSDFFGNEDGDWTSCIADQLGQDGNITADPLFCDADGDDFGLLSDSPCLATNNGCGDMGRYGQQCDVVPILSSSWGRVKGQFYGSR
ncbi:MAG: right-handed parallel beta-helix repeat-containing protein [Candidatus Eisenbacteria bacterium]